MDWSNVKKPLVLYHSPCRDGWAAAFLAKLRWKDAELIGQQYQDPVIRDGSPLFTLRVDGHPKGFDFTGRDVILLDFTYPRETLLAIREHARSLVVLDHHASAKKDLEGLDFCVFDESRSGCGIALDEFFPGWRSFGQSDPEPEGYYTAPFDATTVVYVATRCEAWDLWKHDLYPDVKTICAYLDVLDQTFEAWSEAFKVRDDVEVLDDMAARGEAILAYQRKQVERIAEHAHDGLWIDQKTPLRVCNTPVLQSEVGEFLYTERPDAVALVWYRGEDGPIRCSLRSKTGSPFNVSEMAKAFGGGGHFNSAGFKGSLSNENVKIVLSRFEPEVVKP